MSIAGHNGSNEEGIGQLLDKFDEWGKGKKTPGDRIPVELWSESVKLAEKHTVIGETIDITRIFKSFIKN
jgi:hypothetical protein